jgi:lysophospholipase L1-like esterase
MRLHPKRPGSAGLQACALAKKKGRLRPVLLLLLAATAAAYAQPPQSDLERLVEAQRRILTDWAGLIHYGSEDTEVPPPKPGENRVVFLGDDITEAWAETWTRFFPDKPYINRGIRRQTSPQMLVRFRQDVISLKPKVVIISAGLNDLAGYTGPATEKVIAENIETMSELAKLHNIKVILASVTPICDCYTHQTGRRPQGRIIGLNGWLKDYAAANNLVYLDYYSALAEGRNLKKEYTPDGVLLNQAAYAVMAPLAEKAISAALSK